MDGRDRHTVYSDLGLITYLIMRKDHSAPYQPPSAGTLLISYANSDFSEMIKLLCFFKSSPELILTLEQANLYVGQRGRRKVYLENITENENIYGKHIYLI